MSASKTQSTLNQSATFGNSSSLSGNRVLVNRYEIQRKLGSGNFGTAYLVKDLKVNSGSKEELKVAKQMSVGDIAPDETLESIKEGRLLSKLSHPGIVKFYDSFFDNEMFCIVTEYCEGGDLKTKIAEAKKKNSFFEESVVVDWFVQLMLAVEYIHNRRILHRDLTTGNVFLKNDMIKLGDFGISRVLMGTLDMASTFTGTPYYMSPEVLKHDGYNSKSDIWSVGCILYEMCTLNHAFEGQGLMGVMYKIVEGEIPKLPDRYSPELNEVFLKILARDIHSRPSASDILQISFISTQIEQLKNKLETTSGDAVPRKVTSEQLEKEARDISALVNEPAHLEDLRKTMAFEGKDDTSSVNQSEATSSADGTIKAKSVQGTLKGEKAGHTLKSSETRTVKSPTVKIEKSEKQDSTVKPVSTARKVPVSTIKPKISAAKTTGPTPTSNVPRIKSGAPKSGNVSKREPVNASVKASRQPNAEEIAAAEAEFLRSLKQTRASGAFKATYETSHELKESQTPPDSGEGTVRRANANRTPQANVSEEEDYQSAVEAERAVGIHNLSPKHQMVLRKRQEADEKAKALKQVTKHTYLTQRAKKEDYRETMMGFSGPRKPANVSPSLIVTHEEQYDPDSPTDAIDMQDDGDHHQARGMPSTIVTRSVTVRRDDRPITPMKKDLYKDASKALEFQQGVPVNPEIADYYYTFNDDFEDADDPSMTVHRQVHFQQQTRGANVPLVSQSFNPRQQGNSRQQRIRFVAQDGNSFDEEFGQHDDRSQLANYMATILTRPAMPRRSMTFIDEDAHRDVYGPQVRNSKIKTMRNDCERRLGPVKFRQVYDYLKGARSGGQTDDYNEQRITNDLRRMLGDPHDAFLVDQLLFLENTN